jgi:UDP-glucuronate 4-epimerase
MAERVLLTGAAGFIGSHVAEALIARGDAVTGVDNFDDFYPAAVKRANLAALLPQSRFTLVEADVRDAAAMRRAVADGKPSVIVHLAARAGVRPSIAQPALYADVNIGGTVALLQAAREAGITRFVFGSSSSVYGDNATPPFREDDPAIAPISPYAASKRGAELQCEAFSALEPAMRIISLRFFTVYGPRQRPDLAIHSFTRLLESGQPITIFGDGSASRDYTYVSDIVQGVIAAIDRTRAVALRHEIINLGEQATTTVNELVALIEAATGRTAAITRKPAQPGDVQRTFADISRARTLLGYAPQVGVRDGIPRFVDWYRRHAAPAMAAEGAR